MEIRIVVAVREVIIMAQISDLDFFVENLVALKRIRLFVDPLKNVRLWPEVQNNYIIYNKSTLRQIFVF